MECNFRPCTYKFGAISRLLDFSPNKSSNVEQMHHLIKLDDIFLKTLLKILLIQLSLTLKVIENRINVSSKIISY